MVFEPTCVSRVWLCCWSKIPTFSTVAWELLHVMDMSFCKDVVQCHYKPNCYTEPERNCQFSRALNLDATSCQPSNVGETRGSGLHWAPRLLLLPPWTCRLRKLLNIKEKLATKDIFSYKKTYLITVYILIFFFFFFFFFKKKKHKNATSCNHGTWILAFLGDAFGMVPFLAFCWQVRVNQLRFGR